MTQIYINKTYTNIGHKSFEQLVPSVAPLLEKHIRLGHVVSWTVPSIYQYKIFKKKYKKGMDRSNKIF